jgi:hypothetical protein
MSGVKHDQGDALGASDYFGSERRAAHTAEYDPIQTACPELIAQHEDFVDQWA